MFTLISVSSCTYNRKEDCVEVYLIAAGNAAGVACACSRARSFLSEFSLGCSLLSFEFLGLMYLYSL